jgi:predicted transcriptional regulator
MKEKRHAYIIRILSALAAFQQSVNDKFFSNRLTEKTNELIESYLEILKLPIGDSFNVAQSRSLRNHFVIIDSLGDLLEEMNHLNLGNQTPLLISHGRLLRHKLQLLKIIPSSEKKVEKIELDPKPILKKIKSKSVNDLTITTEKIFDFIKNKPRVRTKEIIDQFSALSERTVKRSLKELIRRGLLKKESENRAMYYSASFRNRIN